MPANVLLGTDKPVAGGSRERVLGDLELALVWRAADLTPLPFDKREAWTWVTGPPETCHARLGTGEKKTKGHDFNC